MKGESPDSFQTSFLMSGLSEQLNPRHPNLPAKQGHQLGIT
jgi:hypothetical protein